MCPDWPGYRARGNFELLGDLILNAMSVDYS